MRGFNRPVRFGTKKIVGFPRLIAIFAIAPARDSSVNGGAELGALLRICGRIKC
jgi:hypothetical protein